MDSFKSWQVLGAGFINAMLIAGATIYAFGLFVVPIQEEFDLSREQANFGILALYLSLMVWAVLVGRWLEKYSAKTFSILGALAFLAGYVGIVFAPSPLFIIAAILFPLGFGFTAVGPFLENVLAARWFAKMRGRALGIAAVATSAGGLLVVPVFANLMEHFGWRQATLIMAGAICAIIILIAWKFVESRPNDENIAEETAEIFGDDASANLPKDKPKVFSRIEFWLIALGAGLLLGSDQALLTSLIPYGIERGFSAKDAAYLMPVMAGSAIAGKLVVGWLAERFDKRLLFALVCACNLAFLFALLMAPSYGNLMIIVAFVGLAIGGVYPVWTTLTAQAFGREHFSSVIGAMNLVTVPLLLISITIAGRTFDQTGSYDLAFKIFIPQVILAAILVAALRLKKT